jgi:ABC-2 type transport system ATP-binding protein
MSHTVIVELRDIQKAYGGHVALDGLSLVVHPGVHALLGPNGSGKTTAVRVITTLLHPDAGSVRVAGFDAVTAPLEVRRRIAVTGQYAAVDGALTGRENLVQVGRLLGLSGAGGRRRADDLLERFDLTAAGARRVAGYSGGMRRRLDLAVSLVHPPQVLVLDEPTTGLDARSRRALWEQVRGLAGAGTTVLLTTQYLDEADVLADRISVIDRGRVVAEGTAEQLKAQVGAWRLRLLDDDRVVADLPTDGTAADVVRRIAGLGAGADGLRVEVHRPSLEEAFLALTGQRAAAHDERVA